MVVWRYSSAVLDHDARWCWVVRLTPGGKERLVTIKEDTGWTPEPVLALSSREKSFALLALNLPVAATLFTVYVLITDCFQP